MKKLLILIVLLLMCCGPDAFEVRHDEITLVVTNEFFACFSNTRLAHHTIDDWYVWPISNGMKLYCDGYIQIQGGDDRSYRVRNDLGDVAHIGNYDFDRCIKIK
jgi:hypothetical protein